MSIANATLGNAAQTDFQVAIDLGPSNVIWDRLVSGASADCSDIRVTDGTDAPVSFWIELCDPTNKRALIWVKVPSIAASATLTYKLHYGDASATGAACVGTASCIDSTMDFGDDFRTAGSIHPAKWAAGDGTAASGTLFTLAGSAPDKYLQITGQGTVATGTLRSVTALSGARVLQSGAKVAAQGGDGMFMVGVKSAGSSGAALTSYAGILSVQSDSTWWAGSSDVLTATGGYNDTMALQARYTMTLDGENAAFTRENRVSGVYSTAWQRPDPAAAGPFPFTNADAPAITTYVSASNVPTTDTCTDSITEQCINRSLLDTAATIDNANCTSAAIDTGSYSSPSQDLTVCNTTVKGLVRTIAGGGSGTALVIPLKGLTIGGGTQRFTGTRPVIVVVDGAVSIAGAGAIDVSSRTNGSRGAGAATCTAGAGGKGNDGLISANAVAGCGGGGGSFATAGGNGGTPGTAATSGSTTPSTLIPLRGGCSGGTGGWSNGCNCITPGAGGLGGGALQITARSTITLNTAGSLTAAGGGGGGGNGGYNPAPSWEGAGGGGGGSGGAILLETSSGSISGAGTASVAGGNGGGGGGGVNSTTCGSAASGGSGSDGATGGGGGGQGKNSGCGNQTSGGAGGAPGTNSGGNGSNRGGGGGGGGGAGTLVTRTRATVDIVTSRYSQHLALGHRFDDCCGSAATIDVRWTWVLARKYHIAPPVAVASNVEHVGP